MSSTMVPDEWYLSVNTDDGSQHISRRALIAALALALPESLRADPFAAMNLGNAVWRLLPQTEQIERLRLKEQPR